MATFNQLLTIVGRHGEQTEAAVKAVLCGPTYQLTEAEYDALIDAALDLGLLRSTVIDARATAPWERCHGFVAGLVRS